MAEARSRGLWRRRFGRGLVGALLAAAGAAGIGVLVAMLHHEIRTPPDRTNRNLPSPSVRWAGDDRGLGERGE